MMSFCSFFGGAGITVTFRTTGVVGLLEVKLGSLVDNDGEGLIIPILGGLVDGVGEGVIIPILGGLVDGVGEGLIIPSEGGADGVGAGQVSFAVFGGKEDFVGDGSFTVERFVFVDKVGEALFSFAPLES
jgi:hypothetical protein